jgi:hypothetical protein
MADASRAFGVFALRYLCGKYMNSRQVWPPSAETYTALFSHLYAQLGLVGVSVIINPA